MSIRRGWRIGKEKLVGKIRGAIPSTPATRAPILDRSAVLAATLLGETMMKLEITQVAGIAPNSEEKRPRAFSLTIALTRHIRKMTTSFRMITPRNLRMITIRNPHPMVTTSRPGVTSFRMTTIPTITIYRMIIIYRPRVASLNRRYLAVLEHAGFPLTTSRASSPSRFSLFRARTPIPSIRARTSRSIGARAEARNSRNREASIGLIARRPTHRGAKRGWAETAPPIAIITIIGAALGRSRMSKAPVTARTERGVEGYRKSTIAMKGMYRRIMRVSRGRYPAITRRNFKMKLCKVSLLMRVMVICCPKFLGRCLWILISTITLIAIHIIVRGNLRNTILLISLNP